MPLFRYFAFVGAALLVLLFAAAALMPQQVTVARGGDDIDKTTIRIHAQKTGPAAVVMNVQQPPSPPDPQTAYIFPEPSRPAPETAAETKLAETKPSDRTADAAASKKPAVRKPHLARDQRLDDPRFAQRYDPRQDPRMYMRNPRWADGRPGRALAYYENW